MKTSFRILVLILLGVWVGSSLFNNKEYKDLVVAKAERRLSAIPVETFTVKSSSLTTTIDASGKVEGTNEVFVVATVAGEVKRIYVQPGSVVRKGQLLATIDSYYLQEQFELAKAAYEQDTKDYERLRAMAEVNAVTGQQLEQYALKVSASNTQMKLAQRRVQDANIKASVAGTVNQVFTSEGSMLGPGKPLCEIVGGDFNRVKAGIQERWQSYLRPGMQVTLKDFQEVIPTSAFVAAIGIKPDQLGKVPIEINFAPVQQLYAGRLVDVAIKISTDSGLFIPQQAIVQRGGQSSAMIFEDHQAQERRLTLADGLDGFVRVLEGLSTGDQVILTGNMLVKPGDSVRVVAE